jgi:hypothetical protein
MTSLPQRTARLPPLRYRLPERARDGSTQLREFVVRIDCVHFRARLSGQLLPDFLWNARVCHRAIEAVPQINLKMNLSQP